MVLSKAAIRERLRLEPHNESAFAITPLPTEGAFDADAVDLRLGSHFLLPSAWNTPFATPYSLTPLTTPRVSVHVPIGRYLVLPPHQTALGATLEFIKLPADVSGQVLTKSSVARTFVVVETAPWIHPAYRGCLTLEVANVSNTPVLLYPGTPLCQLVLLMVRDPEPPPARLSGRFVGPVRPEGPALGLAGHLRILGATEAQVLSGPGPKALA